MRQNRLEDAKASLCRLTSRGNTDFDVDKSVALMALTTDHERDVNASTTYVACFRGTDLRRTIIVIGCYCMQVLSGSTLRAYATYFFQQAGLPTDQAFNMSIVAYALALIGVIVAVSLYGSLAQFWKLSPDISFAVALDASRGPTYAFHLGTVRLGDLLLRCRRAWNPPVRFTLSSPRMEYRGNAAHLCLYFWHYNESCIILSGLRDSILTAPKQIGRHRTRFIRVPQHRCERGNSIPAQPVGLGLGRQERILLGWRLHSRAGIHVPFRSRTERSDNRRAGSPV